MNSRIAILVGVVLVVVLAAFGVGYYLKGPAAQAPALPQPGSAPAPTPVSGLTPAPEAMKVEQPAATPAPATPKPRQRYADYASGEGDYSAPPPPPPPPDPSWRNHRDPFEGAFSAFPMRHAGDGTPSAPLTWSAQTAFGNGREADLRIAILVPEPPADDRGAFWRSWAGRGGDNLMPEVTRGTPVIVTGSASVILTVDPDIVDLDAPALLIVRGEQGHLVYRSRDVAPARGEAWDRSGARWIFAPDEAFYRALRDGGRISFEVHSRIADRDIRIPFDSGDFGPTAMEFEHALAARLDDIGRRWEQASGGRSPPPPPPAPPPAETTHPAPTIVPPPPVVQGAPDRSRGRGAESAPPLPKQGPVAGNAAALVAAYRAPADQCGAHPDLSQARLADPARLAAARAAYAQDMNWLHCRMSWFNGYDASFKALQANIAAEGTTLTAVPGGSAVFRANQSARKALDDDMAEMQHYRDAYNAANAKERAPGPPPQAASKPVPGTPPARVPAADHAQALVAAYRPPADHCGARPDLSTAGLEGPAPQALSHSAYQQRARWVGCHAAWMEDYDASFAALEQQVSAQGANLSAAPAGAAVIQAHDAAKRASDADAVQWRHYAETFDAVSKKSQGTPAAKAPPAKH